MAAVSSKDTKPEMQLRRQVWRMGIRFFTCEGWRRPTGVSLPGSPDLIFPSARLAVFVDGCFWHGCPEHYQAPKDNAEFWATKLKENTKRDARVNEALQADSWNVLRIWEHDLKAHILQDVARKVVCQVRRIQSSIR